MLKWALIVAGALVALILLVTVIGFLLPKGHVASARARYAQKPQAIWDIITNFEALPSWRSDVTSVERAPDSAGHPVWVEIGKNGRIPLAVEVLEPPRRMVTRIADDSLPFGGTWTFEIADSEGGCTLTITENGEVYNPIFRFVSQFFIGHHATLEGYLRSLGTKFGESTTIQRA